MAALLMILATILCLCAVAQAENWTCNHDGQVNDGNFCIQCGRRREEANGWVCPTCGQVNVSEANFCKNCGTKKGTESQDWQITNTDESWVVTTPAGDGYTEQNTGLAIPSNFTASVEGNKVNLSWNAIQGASYYELEYRKDSDTKWKSERRFLNQTTYTISGLEEGTKYVFRVRAKANGVYSSYATVTATPRGTISTIITMPPATQAPTQVPTQAPTPYVTATPTASPTPLTLSVPGGLKATAKDTTVTLTWNAVPNAEYYEIDYRKGSERSWTSDRSYCTETQDTVYGLTAGTRYEFRVRAKKGDIYSSYSTVSCTLAENRTFQITSTSYKDGYLTVKWEDSAGASPYTVSYRYLDSSSAQWNFVLDSTYSKNYVLGDCSPGHTFLITVTDKNNVKATKQVTTPDPLNFEDGKLAYTAIKVSIEPRARGLDDDATAAKKISGFKASELISQMGKKYYGFRYTVSYPQLAKPRTYHTQITIEAPSGYFEILDMGETEYSRFDGKAQLWWYHIGTSYFDNMYKLTNEVPTGKYTVQLYWDGMWVNTTTFQVDK